MAKINEKGKAARATRMQKDVERNTNRGANRSRVGQTRATGELAEGRWKKGLIKNTKYSVFATTCVLIINLYTVSQKQKHDLLWDQAHAYMRAGA